ncbi:hypothetical protein, partial [uncultured Mailhella sp.]|uniref:hypothetical protein n=1 Tax=uncultured Mailhella sp. TaxID=1981031 RepID=UPI0025F99EC5
LVFYVVFKHTALVFYVVLKHTAQGGHSGPETEKRTHTSFVNGMIACETMPQSPQQGKCFPSGERGGLSQEQTPCCRKIHCKYGVLLLSDKAERQNSDSFFYKRVISERRRFRAAPA